MRMFSKFLLLSLFLISFFFLQACSYDNSYNENNKMQTDENKTIAQENSEKSDEEKTVSEEKNKNDLTKETVATEQKNNEINCSKLQFTKYFAEPKYIKYVGQIGAIHGSGTTVVGRSYIHIKEEYASEKIPVYAPVDMTLTMGSYYSVDKYGKILNETSENILPDYILHFEVECGYNVEFCHLKEVVPQIKTRFPYLRNTSATDSVEPIDFKAGDLIGYFIPNKGVAAFDFIVNNESKTNQFQNQKRYEFGYGSNLLHSMCPYDLYPKDIKKQYYDLLGGGGGTLFKVKDCGNISRDKPGTVSGLWYLEEEPVREMHLWIKEGDYGSPVPIIDDEERISIGNLAENVIWIYYDNPTYKNPMEITDKHCYQIYSTPTSKEGYVFLKVISNNSIKLSYSKTGNCPSTFPENNFRIYYK